MKQQLSYLNNTIKFSDLECNGNDKIQKPVMTICDIDVYLVTDNAPLKDFSISIIAESLYCDKPIICIDNYFMELNYPSKLFSIYHELGHYVNGDLIRENTKKERFINFINMLSRKNIPLEEQKADLYAYNKLKEHYPGCIDKIMNNLFYDIMVICIKQLRDNVKDEKKINKYIDSIKKELLLREKILRQNLSK